MSLDIFCAFLNNAEVSFQRKHTLEETVMHNFDVLGDDILRQLIIEALKERDLRLARKHADESTLLGDWGEMIEVIKNCTQRNRDNASEHVSTILGYAREENPKSLIRFIRNMHASGQVNRIFREILENTHDAYVNANNGDLAALLQFALEVIGRLDASPNSETNTNHKENTHPAVSIKSSDISSSSSTNNKIIDISDPAYQKQLEDAGKYLTSILKVSSGDVKKLQEIITSDINDGKLGEPFKKVLSDNIAACEQAGYVNKLKVLQFIEKTIKTSQSKDVSSTADYSIGSSSTYHAPKFLDHIESFDKSTLKIVSPETFINGGGFCSNLLQSNIKNTKKKMEKKAAKTKAGSVAEILGRHLDEHGWAVCDNFLPADLVRRVRIETSVFTELYEQSEIWIGKQADLGAQISVPSVRGDKVLWMCGAHTAAPEGMSRVIKTHGEVEPCKLEIKAAAPIRKFHGIKELLNACDKLMEEMKPRVKALNGIYERSDAMLAIYPGEGSRFANHVDNTTGDGRRVTMLVYLNPEWTTEMGGALRVTTPANRRPQTVGTDEGNTAVDILPLSGRLAMFYSSEVAHEVLPTFGQRHAITLWYYDSEERHEALTKARELGMSAEAAKTSIESQKEAKTFMADLMGGVEVGDDGGSPSQEDVSVLADKVWGLSSEALTIVANITGAPSVTSFKEGFKLLVPQDLKSMRQLFRRMGLQ